MRRLWTRLPGCAASVRTRPAAIMLTAIAAAVSLLAACGASSSGVGTATRSRASASAPGGSALARWNAVYSYLEAQTEPAQIMCNWAEGTPGTPSIKAAPRTARFYSFNDPKAWRDHLVTRFDTPRDGVYEMCLAMVPATVRYESAAIASFLAPFGLYFVDASTHADGLVPIEIAYAGQNASDPDIIYRNRPGLFALRGALLQAGSSAFEPGTSKIVPPPDNATAARYLRFTKPLLSWYGFKG